MHENKKLRCSWKELYDRVCCKMTTDRRRVGCSRSRSCEKAAQRAISRVRVREAGREIDR